MKILHSSFEHNNFDAVKAFIKKSNIIKEFRIKESNISAPQLWFFDKNEIEAGYYDFVIEGMLFTECWIAKHSTDANNRNLYHSGSYRVFTI